MAATGFTPIQIYYSTTASAVPTAGNLLPGELALNIADMKLYCENSSGVVTLLASATGASGDVVGPASSTDNAIVRFDGTTGKLVQDSAVTIADDGATVISTNSTTDALRITQTGTGNALVIEDSANPDSTPFVVNASGQLLLGNTTTWPTGGGVAIALTSESGSTPNGNIASRRYATDADATIFTQAKARGTLASPTVVADSDALGNLQWQGYDGTTFVNCVRIRAEVDGTPGTNDVPGRLVFFITPDGSTVPTERMRISNAGVVTITGTGIINASSSSDALRITQTGAGNALVIEDSANPDSSPVVVDTNGTVLVGDTVSRTIAGVTTSRLQVASESSNGFQAGLSAIAWDADAPGSILSAPVISMSRSASDTTGTQAAVSQNQFLGTLNFSGSDGTQFIPAAQIICGVDGTVGTNDMPGRLVFLTTADGSATPTERMRIDNAGLATFTGTVRTQAAATQDAVALQGRAGGTSSYAATITPTTLTANRTVTIPNEDFTVGFRNVPPVGAKTSSYILATDDVGKYVEVGSGGSITIPDATFASGDVVSIFNNTSGSITITCTITTAYIAGTDADKATVSLATRGVATLLFISGTVCVITGNVS
jgi:hypothetical protein